jgi:hypothetical protein
MRSFRLVSESIGEFILRLTELELSVKFRRNKRRYRQRDKKMS